MSTSSWTVADTARACQVWAEYLQQHDISDRIGQTAGIDPISGRIWFGESAKDIYHQRQAEGDTRPIYCVRVGYDYYLRKGGHR